MTGLLAPPGRPAPIIDINCDMGERPGLAGISADVRLMEFVTSVNISCGAHAGNEATTRAVAKAAHARHLRVGAHPGYPDPENFGRVPMPMTPRDLEASLVNQLRLFARVAADLAFPITHIKPHGALYHDIHQQDDLADTFIRAVRTVFATPPAPPGPPALVALAGSPRLAHWRREGLTVLAEAFAERAYQPDATLVPRTQPNALIHDPAAAAQQAHGIARYHRVATAAGPTPVHADTICIHSDSPNAEEIARAVCGVLRVA